MDIIANLGNFLKALCDGVYLFALTASVCIGCKANRVTASLAVTLSRLSMAADDVLLAPVDDALLVLLAPLTRTTLKTYFLQT